MKTGWASERGCSFLLISNIFPLYIHIVHCEYERWKCVICFPLVCFFLPSFSAEYKQNQSCYELLLLILWTALYSVYCSQLTWYNLRLLTELLVRPDGEIFHWLKDSRSVLTESQIFSRPGRPNSVNKHVVLWLLCLCIFPMEQTFVNEYTFLAEPDTLFQPYHSMCMSLIQDLFFMWFINKIVLRDAQVI